MRLLHTSDWHVGKRFHQVDLLDQQAIFFDWLIHVVRSENIECMLVSGDIFDRATPKGDAVELVNDVLGRLFDEKVQVVAISGNHDSAERLNFGSTFMARAGIHFRTERPRLTDIGAPITITGKGGESTQILPIPYLDPQRVSPVPGVERDHGAVVQAVIAHQLSNLNDPTRSIVMSHSFVAGGSESDSERPLSVGGTSQINPGIFAQFGYVALGHLHKPQKVGGGNIFYSGSPLPYSFSEEHDKLVRVINTEPGMSVSDIGVEVGIRVATITDSLEKLLSSAKYSYAEKCFVRAMSTDETLQVGAMEKLRQRFPNILEIEQNSMVQQRLMTTGDTRKKIQRNPIEIVDEYITETLDEGLSETAKKFVLDSVSQVVGSANS